MIRLVRFGVERQLLRRVEREVQAVVTVEALERFGRETLVGLLPDQARARVTLVHRDLLVAAALATLGPLVYLILRG